MRPPSNTPVNRLSVLQYTEAFYPVYGGAEMFVMRLANQLLRLGAATGVLTYQLRQDWRREECLGNLPVHRIPHPNIKFLGAALGIFKTLQFIWRHRRKFAVIHIHGVGLTAAAIMLMSQFTGQKIVTHLTGSENFRYTFQSRWRRALIATALQRVHCFIAISSEIKKFLLSRGITSDKLRAIPYGLEIPKIAGAAKINGQRQIAIFVGRLVIEKALDDLFHAWQLICRQRDDCDLWILGDGVLRENLIALAQQLGIAAHVKFWGKVENVFDYLNQAHLFVMSSVSEGLSNALLEAMSIGLPVVATAVSGAVDVIQHEHNGLLVPPSDVQSLAAAVLRLFGNPALAKQLGHAARATVEEKFSIETVAQQHVELYMRLSNRY